ncbi:MAG TPA: hypothetical protein DD723_02290 [Candidatus Omnitrophica bacterium]|nr:MAG: hypothetical protein A2Z81_03500 [Omnitrophica WOR_2 bacterium GWA2_45_18]HBR14357.1 hypothetical protein [Candidatus Omnitrophota bacterium]
MNSQQKNREDDYLKSKEYKKLVVALKKIIWEVQTASGNTNSRYELLTCADCGVYEDVGIDGQLKVLNKDQQFVKSGNFIIIDKEERSYRRNNLCFFKIKYAFICPDCGMYQTEVHRKKFELERSGKKKFVQ